MTGLQIRAQDLEPGCLVKVICPIDGRTSLARVEVVRITGTGIEADIRTRDALPCPGVPYRSNYWTVTASFDQPVNVSHLPSESRHDMHTAHGGGTIR